MIVGLLSDVAKQKNVLPAAIVRALEALKDVDIAKKEPGRYEIEGDKMFYLVQDVELRTMEESRAEAHHQYADIQIPSLLDQLNQRFAPAQPDLGGESLYGGIAEMAEIQKEFAIFKKGRPLQQSMRALNLNAANNAVRQRWLTLIEGLAKHPSNRDGENGGDAIVNALVENFAAKEPLPVFFTSHDMQGKPVKESPVLITPGARPLHYLETDYLVISLPMQSRQAADRMRAQRPT